MKNRYLLFAIPVLFLLGLGLGAFTGGGKHIAEELNPPQDAEAFTVDAIPAPERDADESETAYFDEPAGSAPTAPHPTGTSGTNSGTTSKPSSSAPSGSGSTGSGSAGSSASGGTTTGGGSSSAGGELPPGHPGTGAPSKCPRTKPDSSNP